MRETPEDTAAVAFLDDLRECKGEKYPAGLPLACVVKVLEYADVPKANEAYALVRVEGADGRTWRMCIYRNTVAVGKNALFISERAALPVEPRFQNPAICSVKVKQFKFPFGVRVKRLLPHVKRHVYRNNCGVLFPAADFPELKGRRAGMVVAALLHVDDAEEFRSLQNPPKGTVVFLPGDGTACGRNAIRFHSAKGAMR